MTLQIETGSPTSAPELSAGSGEQPSSIVSDADRDSFLDTLKGSNQLEQRNPETGRDSFLDALKSSRQLEQHNPETGSNNPGQDAEGNTSLGTANPANLFSQHMMDGFLEKMAPVSQTPQPSALSQTDLSTIVDRILVSTPTDGSQEVRITLNNNVLSDTEIVINRNLQGELTVTLNTKDPSSFQTLVSSRNDLQSLLEQKENSPVRVVVDNSETDAESGDQRHRSRGFVDYQQEQES